MQKLLIAISLALCSLLTACGGGGGSSANANAFVSNRAFIASSAPNVQPIVVSTGPTGQAVNMLLTSVTICAPGDASNCQTIDNIQVDTGSSGLRILSSALSPSLALTQQTNGSGQPVAECMEFADGHTWGPIKIADIQIAGEAASSVPIQVFGDSTYSTVPTVCQNSGREEDTQASFYANGVLGIGLDQNDCGSLCQNISGTFYYACPTSTTCQKATLNPERQVQNPVALFPVDNNGVIIQLPSVPDWGSPGESGVLVFGIGTQTNNGLGSATVITVDNWGYFIQAPVLFLFLMREFLCARQMGIFALPAR